MNLRNESPVVIYNADKKEKIGIFKRPSLAGRYLYANDGSRRYNSCIYNALINKTKMGNTDFDFPVAIRYASIEQVKLLGDKDCIVFEGYKEANFHSNDFLKSHQ